MTSEKLERWKRFLREVMCVDGEEYVRDYETFEPDEIVIDGDLEEYGLETSDVEIVLRLKGEGK